MNPPESVDREFLKLQARRRAFQTRLLMFFAIGSTVMLVCCCIPLVILQFAFGPTVTREPAAVQAIAHEIAPLEIPADFSGSLAKSADNSLLLVRIARFDQSEGRGRMVIGQVHMKALPPGNEYDDKLLQSLMDELYPGLRAIDAAETRKLTVKIHDQKVTFEIVKGEDRASTTKLTQVAGTFRTATGTNQLLLQVESEFITQDAIDNLLRSLGDAPDQK